MSDATRRHIMLPALLAALLAFFLGALLYPLMKDEQSTAPSSISNAGPLPRDIREEDRKFLDDLVQNQDQHDRQDGNSLSAPVQNIGNAEAIDSSPKSVPRAELVTNSEIVRRGELIVHSGTVKRKRQSITP